MEMMILVSCGIFMTMIIGFTSWIRKELKK